MSPQDPNMRAWATAYARRGLRVIPLHVVITDDNGNTIGCTCEAYRRSKGCKERSPQAYLGPDGKCKDPGKHPIVSAWEQKATIDEDQIQKWWGRPWHFRDVENQRPVWLYPGIAIAAGASGLLVVDLDLYKDTYSGTDLDLSDEEEETVRVITGSGGYHNWYAMPEDKQWGNSTDGLPPGVDIRGHGGLVVVPPTLHESGRRYVFELDHAPDEIDIRPIPDKLAKILDGAERKRGYSGPRTAGPADSEAVRQSCDLVEAVLEHAEISHSGAQTWGETGRRYILHQCPYNPPEDPHADDAAAFVVIYDDGVIGAGCHHARCKHVIDSAGVGGWQLLKQRSGFLPPSILAQTDSARRRLHSAEGTELLTDTFRRSDGARFALKASARR